MTNKENVIKTKIMEHFGLEIYCKLQDVMGEVYKLQEYPQLSIRGHGDVGPGLDLQVLQEKLQKAIRLTELIK